MICPLKLINNNVAVMEDGSVRTEMNTTPFCIGKECAWWKSFGKDRVMCAVLLVAESLSNIDSRQEDKS